MIDFFNVTDSDSDSDSYNVYSEQKLNTLMDENGIINGDIVIRGDDITSLGKLAKVFGSIGIDSNSLENLGELNYVDKDFWIVTATNLNSLFNLEKVGENLNLSKSCIKDLGNLSYVGEKLSLRNINVVDLSKLRYAKILFLSKKLIDINLDHIEKSVVRYWSDKKSDNDINTNILKNVGGKNLRYNVFIKKDNEIESGFFTKSHWDVVWDSNRGFEIWLLKYKISSNPLNSYYVSDEVIKQQDENFKFYKFQIDKDQEYLIDFKYTDEISNLNERLIYELLLDCVNGIIDCDTLIYKLHYYENVFKKFKLNNKFEFLPLYELLDQNNIIESLIDSDNKSLGYAKLHEIELRLKKRQITGKTIVGKGLNLNGYIKNNFSEFQEFVDNKLDMIYDGNYSFYKSLFGELLTVEEINDEFPKKFKKVTHKNSIKNREESFKYIDQNKTNKIFQKYYTAENKFNSDDIKRIKKTMWNGGDLWLSYNQSPLSYYNSNGFIYFVENILENIFTSIVIGSQDDFRVSKGIPKIGEGWVSETDLFYRLKSIFLDEEVIQHASPKWLGRQHLDIFFPKLKIAVEYQGRQHSAPINFFGGEEGFLKTIERDQRKYKLCVENKCKLFYVYPETNIDEFIIELKSFIQK